MTVDEHAKLSALAEEMEDPDVKSILLVVSANEHCGASNEPIAEFCRNIARQMLADLTP